MIRPHAIGRGRPLSRRAVLRGVGAAVALPWLEAMLPWGRSLASADDAAETPLRLAFLFVPNGVHMPDWTPKAEGAEFALPWILEPLERHRSHLLVMSGLAQDQAKAHGDGPGDHARSGAVFLTGAHPVKTAGRDIRVGVSVDQVAARHLEARTRFGSLELGCEGSQLSGNCDSGYSCAYSGNISWRTPTTPTLKEIDPRVVFDRLFGDGRPGESEEARARRRRYRKSILDLVKDDAARLSGRLGKTDRAKVDEYLTGVREIERQIERAEADREKVRASGVELEAPTAIPRERSEHIRMIGDLMVLAFQLDQTRVATFMFANAGSGWAYKEIGVRQGHHPISHHGGDAAKLEMIRKINRLHVEQLAYVLDRMKAVKEGDGTLLDNVMLVYGSCIGDGNRHNHDDLPVLVAGGGRGTVRAGRHVRYARGTPLGNLYLSMLERVGCDEKAFGDSTGPLDGLA